MDKETQRNLIVRLNWILAKVQAWKMESAEEEIRELLKDVKEGCIVPF